MSRLSSSETARIALARKKVEARAAIFRGRVEALPGAGQASKMGNAENRIRLLQLDVANKLMDEIDDALMAYQRRLEEAEMATAGQRQDQLLAARGIETILAGSVRSRDGWRWLVAKRRISDSQCASGERFAKLHSVCMRDGLSVATNDNTGSGGLEDINDARLKAAGELRALRKHIHSASGSDRLFDLLEAVCGRGDTLRTLAGGDDRKALFYEAEMRVALDMASVAFRAWAKTTLAERAAQSQCSPNVHEV